MFFKKTLYYTILMGLLLCQMTSTNEKESRKKECESDEECSIKWPRATCRRAKCHCPANSIRRASQSRGWVCLSLIDSGIRFPAFMLNKRMTLRKCVTVTQMLGPPLVMNSWEVSLHFHRSLDMPSPRRSRQVTTA